MESNKDFLPDVSISLRDKSAYQERFLNFLEEIISKPSIEPLADILTVIVDKERDTISIYSGFLDYSASLK